MIVGLTGYKGSGKTEVARMLGAYAFVRCPFAQTLKAMLSSAGLSDEQLNGPLKEEPCELLGGKTPRWAMQTLGTEWGRNLIHPNLWVTLWSAARRIELRSFASQSVVADDVRFPNEVTAIRELGGEVWRITRWGCESDGHESEHYISSLDTDLEIYNNGDLASLKSTVDWAMSRRHQEIHA